MRLPHSFYRRADVVATAQELLGQHVVRATADGIMRARIVETEAYNGPHDRACHAYGHRRTPRTETMYRPGGVAYVYFIYGIHHMLNVVTHEADEPYAVLIRAVEPLAGTDLMLANRKLSRLPNEQPPKGTGNGPGVLCQALGITRALDGTDLVNGTELWIEAAPYVAAAEIIASPRVGVAYAGEDARLPYRFRIRDSIWTSRAK